MHKPYFSRFLNERKRKLKAAYIAKVITGVVAALAISSSSFAVMAHDADPFEALGIDISVEEQGALESLDDNPDFDIGGESDNLDTDIDSLDSLDEIDEISESDEEISESETDVTAENVTDSGGEEETENENPDEISESGEVDGIEEIEEIDEEINEDETDITAEEEESEEEAESDNIDEIVPEEMDDGALAAYELAMSEYVDAEAAYTAAWDNYQLMKADFLNGTTEYADVEAAYVELADLYQELVDAHVAVELAQGNVDEAFEVEMDEYRDAVKEYRAAKAAYNAAMKVYTDAQSDHIEKMAEYNTAMDEYKQELSDYAKELSSYARQLADYRTAQAAYESEQLKFDEAMAELTAEMNAPTAPTTPTAPTLVKPEAPPEVELEEPEAPELVRPEVPDSILSTFDVELEDFDLGDLVNEQGENL